MNTNVLLRSYLKAFRGRFRGVWATYCTGETQTVVEGFARRTPVVCSASYVSPWTKTPFSIVYITQYGSETWRLTENNKRRVEATEMDVLRRSSRISRKERIRNVTIRQQIGLEETIIKEIEQNHLTWYGHVQRMVEWRLPKIALKWMPKQKRARGRPKKNWMEDKRKAMNERNLNEGQWEDRKQWSLGVGQRRKTFWNRYTQI